MTSTEINAHLDSLQVTMSGLITDYADISTRGHLVEHPDLVNHRLGLALEMLVEIQAAVDTEHASSRWPVLRAHPGAEHDQRAAEYAHHQCDCPHCLHGGGPGDDEGDIWI